MFWGAIAAAFAAALSLGIYWIYEPARISVENRAFHESQSYNDGMTRDLENLRLAYIQADDAGKLAIRATI
jgi:hypothetical protein